MELSHIGEDKNARMVNVSEKIVTKRIAVAEGRIRAARETIEAIIAERTVKGNVLNTAKVAGIMAAKRTSELIPMCHNVPLEGLEIEFTVEETGILITATAETSAKTGVEMEALTAVSVTALTVYDMAKAIDKNMEITDVHLVIKSGGKSGIYRRV